MNKKSIFLLFEAFCLGAPITLFFLFGLPYIVGGSLYLLSEGHAQSTIGAIGCIWALFEFWKLAIHTATQRIYKFGYSFIFASIGAILGTWIMHEGFSNEFFSLLVGLPVLGTLHFLYEQYRLRKSLFV